MPSIYGPKFQLEWAGRFLESLSKEVQAFEKENRIRPRKYTNGNGEIIYQGRLKSMPAPRMSFLLADVVHNMRVALDHLAWQLATINNSKPPRETGFPILPGRLNWESKTTQDKIRHFPLEAREVVERFQPETGRHLNHPLWILHTLDIFAKHQDIPVVGTAVIDQSEIEGVFFGGIQDDGTFMYFVPPDKNDFKPELTVRVEFGGNALGANITMPTIYYIHDFINSEVFPAFEGFFK